MLPIKIKTQPNDVTCGPTSLHAVYKYYGEKIALEQVIDEVNMVSSGGTIAPFLGLHALLRGYSACIYVYNLGIFDPSWFHSGKSEPKFLIKKLQAQLIYKNSKRQRESTMAYINYLKAGGKICFRDLTPQLIKKFFEKKIPILAGLSATYLYQSKREYGVDERSMYHDLRGYPCGHFVVLCGYDEMKRHIVIADPHRSNPIAFDNYYKVGIHRLITAILLGVLTHDANLLTLHPKPLDLRHF